MVWKLGQTVQCDRPEGAIVGYIVQIEFHSLVISCPAIQTVICGQQQQLEQLGWKLVESDEAAHGETDETAYGKNSQSVRSSPE